MRDRDPRRGSLGSGVLLAVALAALLPLAAAAEGSKGWYHRAGMLGAPLEARDLVDGSFLEEALRILGR